MSHTITLIAGDGIGPEVSEAVLRILHVAGVRIDWDRQDAGITAFERHRTALPVELLDSVKRTRIALKGPVTTPVAKGHQSVNVGLRKSLELFANLRPVKSLPGVQSRYQDVDLIIVRENTEDLYAGLEHEVVPGVVEILKIITETSSVRIARFALDYAKEHHRTRVTAVHKANIMKFSDGVFLATAFELDRTDYPDVELEELQVDEMAMWLAWEPEVMDVLLLPNLYGDIISDLCAGLVGGLGLAPGANLGWEYAVFEPVHGSAPDIAGKGVANPVAMILSAAMMLRHLAEPAAADRVDRAVAALLEEGAVRTPDMGGTATTQEVADALAGRLR